MSENENKEKVDYDYLLLPLSLLLAIGLVSQGVVQSLTFYKHAETLSGSEQVLPMGPAASQIAIKQLGTNGGGFFGVNSAHPFENPTPLSNFLQLLVSLTVVFILAVVTLRYFSHYSEAQSGLIDTAATIPILVSLLVCLIPTTIGGLLSAIGISGIDRLIRKNVMAMSGKAVEASGDIDVLLLDKTGTITLGNRVASGFVPLTGVEEARLADAAQLSSLSDETPEGRSIVVLAKKRFQLRGRDLGAYLKESL